MSSQAIKWHARVSGKSIDEAPEQLERRQLSFCVAPEKARHNQSSLLPSDTPSIINLCSSSLLNWFLRLHSESSIRQKQLWMFEPSSCYTFRNWISLAHKINDCLLLGALRAGRWRDKWWWMKKKLKWNFNRKSIRRDVHKNCGWISIIAITSREKASRRRRNFCLTLINCNANCVLGCIIDAGWVVHMPFSPRKLQKFLKLPSNTCWSCFGHFRCHIQSGYRFWPRHYNDNGIQSNLNELAIRSFSMVMESNISWIFDLIIEEIFPLCESWRASSS